MEERDWLHSWGVGCPGFDRWAVQVGTLPRPAWRSHVIIWEWFPGEAWFLTHADSASAGLLGSLAYREELQIDGREKVSVFPVWNGTESGTEGVVSHILAIFIQSMYSLWFSKLFLKQWNSFFIIHTDTHTPTHIHLHLKMSRLASLSAKWEPTVTLNDLEKTIDLIGLKIQLKI